MLIKRRRLQLQIWAVKLEKKKIRSNMRRKNNKKKSLKLNLKRISLMMRQMNKSKTQYQKINTLRILLKVTKKNESV